MCISFVASTPKVQPEAQLSLTNLPTHLCKRNGVVDLLKHAHPNISYHAEFGRSALKDVGINTENPNIGERWNSALLGWEAWLTPETSPSPMCYQVKFGCSATKGVCINRKESPKLGSARTTPSWGVGRVSDHLKQPTSPYVLLCEIW